MCRKNFERVIKVEAKICNCNCGNIPDGNGIHEVKGNEEFAAEYREWIEAVAADLENGEITEDEAMDFLDSMIEIAKKKFSFFGLGLDKRKNM